MPASSFLNFDFSFLQKGFPPPLEEVTIRPFPFWRPFGVEQDVGLMAMAALARGDGGEFGSEVECLRKVFVIGVERSDQSWKITQQRNNGRNKTKNYAAFVI